MDLLTVLILVLLPRFEAVYHLRVDMIMVQLFATRLNFGWFPAVFCCFYAHLGLGVYVSCVFVELGFCNFEFFRNMFGESSNANALLFRDSLEGNHFQDDVSALPQMHLFGDGLIVNTGYKKGEEGDQEVPLRVQDSPGGRFFGQVGEHLDWRKRMCARYCFGHILGAMASKGLGLERGLRPRRGGLEPKRDLGHRQVAGVLGSACSQAWAGCLGMSVVLGLDEGRGYGPEHGLRPVKERGLDGRRGLRPGSELGSQTWPGRELGSQAWFEARGFGPERRLRPGWGPGLSVISAWAGARVLSSVYSLGLGRGIHAMRTHLCEWFHYAISFSSSSSLSSSPFLKRNAEEVAAGKVRFSNWYWISRWQGLYSRDGHLGVTLIKFASDQSGLMEAMRLAEYFEKDDHGWLGSISALERVFCYFCCP
ncbi:hypothetical protein FXO37_02645 [Capsicum annuum]|nr:hypothetical protein FXO37_02645 [Capsicum annuum]